jgi:hypothetical protein
MRKQSALSIQLRTLSSRTESRDLVFGMTAQDPDLIGTVALIANC